jgi:K+-transporting ATPase ATPase B chain
MTSHTSVARGFDRELISQAIAGSFRKLSPRLQYRNPVMFVVFVCSVLSTGLGVLSLAGHGEAPTAFAFLVAVWLWLTLLFANFAEALAEVRGKPQADAQHRSRGDAGAASMTFTLSSKRRVGDHALYASRRKTPAESVPTIRVAKFILIFLLACAAVLPYSLYGVQLIGIGHPITVTVLLALLVCLTPTTMGALLSALSIAGTDRMARAHVVAASRRSIEAAAHVDVLLLDKTGTITLGDRHAVAFLPAPGVNAHEFAAAALLASLADETPEGCSIVAFAQKQFGIQKRTLAANEAVLLPFSRVARMSGINLGAQQIRKGSLDAIERHLDCSCSHLPPLVRNMAEEVAERGATPLVVIRNCIAIGVIELEDTIKAGIRERLAELRRMGIKSIMVTGDNPVTAEAIALRAGVDDFLVETSPEDRVRFIRDIQARNHVVAMSGDSIHDAQALAQANIALSFDAGKHAASLDKLVEVIQIGKRMLTTRGSLTAFSIANDIAKYFVIIPAAFAMAFPALNALNVMRLATPRSAILSAVIFNALVIGVLIPLALKGVAARHAFDGTSSRHNLWLYGLGGIVAPFVGIKLIDMLLVLVGLA